MQAPTAVSLPAGAVFSAPFNSSFILPVKVYNTDLNSVLAPNGAQSALWLLDARSRPSQALQSMCIVVWRSMGGKEFGLPLSQSFYRRVTRMLAH